MSTLLDFSAGTATGAGGNTLSGRQIVDAISGGTPIVTKPTPGAACAVEFPEHGDIGYRLLLSENCNFSVSGGTVGVLQSMRVFFQQPASGNCEITWPDNIIWTGNAPFVDSQSGSVCCIEIMWDGMSKYYGRMIFG